MKVKPKGRICFLGTFSFTPFHPSPRDPLLLARKLGQGKHFATWLMHAPVKETILQLKEEISVLAISNIYCLLPKSCITQTSRQGSKIATLCMCFQTLILALHPLICGTEKTQF